MRSIMADTDDLVPRDAAPAIWAGWTQGQRGVSVTAGDPLEEQVALP